MPEIAEQIQTPAVSEFPVAEILIEPLPATDNPELQTPEPEPTVQDETALTEQIAQLWRLHSDYKGSIKSQTENLRSLRSELGKLLHQMKALLARPGRNGQWSAWLKERQISRATADRLVTKHERSLNPDGNRLNEQITEPTEEEIQRLFDKLAPKLRKVLRTPASVCRFIDLLASALTPDQQTVVVGSTPPESSVERVAVIADVLVQTNSGCCES